MLSNFVAGVRAVVSSTGGFPSVELENHFDSGREDNSRLLVHQLGSHSEVG